MSTICEVLVSGPPDWCMEFRDKALAEGLIAAGHATPIDTHYVWKGKMVRSAEVRLHLHTSPQLLSAVLDEVKAGHPFVVPFIAHRSLATSPDYASWVIETTSARRNALS